MVIFSILAFYLDQPHMQINGPKNSSFFLLFHTSKVIFPLFFKYHVVFQNKSEDYIGEYGITIWLRSLYVNQLTVHYIVLKELYHRKFWEKYFYPFLQISILKNIQ